MMSIQDTNQQHPASTLTVRRLVTIVALTAAWCALWQRISIANLAAGATVAIAATSLNIGTRGIGTIKARPLAKLIGLVLVDLVVSTIDVAKEILTPTDYTNESIIAVDLPTSSRDHLLLLVVAITLTPGTAVVDTDPHTGTLYLHLLHNPQADTVKTHVHKLATLATQALPTPAPTNTAAELIGQ
jgi:multicomponent Na+:H+ antiporter subunit E